MSQQTNLRVAIVGFGKMGLLHAGILNVMPKVDLVGVCEANSFTRRMFKKVLRDVPFFADVGELLDLNVDAVFVTTPISSHFAVAKRVYEDRLACHLFIEKPLTSSFADSKLLSNLANKNGGVNMVGYLRRFMVTFSKARELLSAGSIGELESFRINAFSSDFYGLKEDSKITLARGGVLADLGSYAIDLILWFFGDLQLISAKGGALNSLGVENEVHFEVVRKSDSLLGEAFVSWQKEGYRMPEVILSVKGSKGTIEVNDDRVNLNLSNGNNFIWYRPNLNDTVKFWLAAPEYFREDECFFNSIRGDLIAEPNFEAAAKTDELIGLIKKQVENNA